MRKCRILRHFPLILRHYRLPADIPSLNLFQLLYFATLPVVFCDTSNQPSLLSICLSVSSKNQHIKGFWVSIPVNKAGVHLLLDVGTVYAHDLEWNHKLTIFFQLFPESSGSAMKFL